MTAPAGPGGGATPAGPRRESRRGRRRAPVAAVTACAAVLSACTAVTGNAPGDAPVAADATPDLGQVCPETVVVQTSSLPRAESGALYHLLGNDPEIEAGDRLVRGDLVAEGEDLGVDLEIRAGGPANGFTPTPELMTSDESITLGTVSTGEAVAAVRRTPVVGVVAPLDVSPQMLMWDPGTHPEFQSVTDVGQSDTTVLHADGAPFMDYLVGSGVLKESQVDSTYDGSLTRFVDGDGEPVQQGVASGDPYVVETLGGSDLQAAYQLVHDLGFPEYTGVLSVRRAQEEELAPCLERLVPVVQRAQAGYVRSPQETNALLVDLARRYDAGPGYTRQQATASVRTQRELGIVGNGPDGTLGDFDLRRVARVITAITPIWEAQGRAVEPDLRPGRVATNAYVDRTVAVPR